MWVYRRLNVNFTANVLVHLILNIMFIGLCITCRIIQFILNMEMLLASEIAAKFTPWLGTKRPLS